MNLNASISFNKTAKLITAALIGALLLSYVVFLHGPRSTQADLKKQQQAAEAIKPPQPVEATASEASAQAAAQALSGTPAATDIIDDVTAAAEEHGVEVQSTEEQDPTVGPTPDPEAATVDKVGKGASVRVVVVGEASNVAAMLADLGSRVRYEQGELVADGQLYLIDGLASSGEEITFSVTAARPPE